MKQCFKCGILKPLSDFYKHPQMADGHVNKCKECNKRDVQENYRARHDQYTEYERKRRPRTMVQVRYKTPEELAFQRKANTAVGNAVRDGRLLKSPCEVCGAEKVHAHHDDYTKPLDVRWLCPKHHTQEHNHCEKMWRPLESVGI